MSTHISYLMGIKRLVRDGKESSHLKFILYGAQPVRRKALPSSHKFPLLELLGGCAFSSLTTSTDAALATGSRLL